MEETKQPTEAQDLEFLPLLKQALKTPFINTHVTFFIVFAMALPLLFLMLFFEFLLEKTIKQSLQVLTHSSYTLYYLLSDYFTYDRLTNLSNVLSEKLIFPSLIYFIPLHLLEFVVGYLTIVFTSKVYRESTEQRNISIRNTIRDIITTEILKGSFITSLYVLLLSTALSLGFISILITSYTFTAMSTYDLVVLAVLPYLAVFAIVFPKYLEANATWNLSFVVSVIGRIHGIDALFVAFRFSMGKEKLGRNLMLVFLIWGLALRIPRMFFDDGTVGIIGRTTLLWIGKLMKWVVCVIYHYQCTGNAFHKKTDEEAGNNHKSNDGEVEKCHQGHTEVVNFEDNKTIDSELSLPNRPVQ